MQRVDVVQLEVPGDVHLRAFDEVSAALHHELRRRGHASDLRRGLVLGPGRNVLLGAHVLGAGGLATVPAGTIVHNFEQITDASAVPADTLAAYAHLTVWEYARANLPRWHDAGIDARHVPLGWSPVATPIDRTGPQPVDVLFYGTVSERRRVVLEALHEAGLVVDARYGTYGRERDELVARAKVVLNVHTYPTTILETVRLSHLWANGVPVVSELSPTTEVPDGLGDAARFVPYEQLVDATIALVDDPAARAELATRGRERMEAQRWRLPADDLA